MSEPEVDTSRAATSIVSDTATSGRQQQATINLEQEEYDDEFKSESSFDELESMRENRFDDIKEEGEEEMMEEEHEVRLTITIMGCFPIDSDDDGKDTPNKPRITEGPKPINFYRFEYQLIPDEPDTLYQADLVTFKNAAKLYPEKSESKILKGWENDNKIWIIWTQPHQLRLTKTKLLKLFDNDIMVKIWDNREFCSAKCRFDKPKPIKFPKNPEERDIKDIIFDECNKYLKQIPKETYDRLDPQLPNQAKIESAAFIPDYDYNKATNTLIAVSHPSAANTIGNKLTDLASERVGGKSVVSRRPTLRTNKSSRMSVDNSTRSKSNRRMTATSMVSSTTKMTRREMAAERESITKNGKRRLRIRTRMLFAGLKTVMDRLENQIENTLSDCFVALDLENDFMSDEQLYDLNPLCIKLDKCVNMPDKPVDYDDLRRKCGPAFCSYKFFDQASFTSVKLSQEKNLYFNDMNVFLVGLMNKHDLKEYFYRSFEIQVHDRDRTERTKEPPKPCIFGNDPKIDSRISNVSLAASKHTFTNPFDVKDQHWDPFGVAKLTLHELILGKRMLEFSVPVLPCAAPDLIGRNNNQTMATNSSLDGSKPPVKSPLTRPVSYGATSSHDDIPMPPGSYLDANTQLNVTIWVAKPVFNERTNRITSKNDLSNPVNQDNCVFSRMVVRVKSTRLDIIKTIITACIEINARAFQLDSQPPAVQEAALSTYKLTEEEQKSKTFNIITGFHLIDPKYHIFALEGLKHGGLSSVKERIPLVRSDSDTHVLYNSDMTFSQRLYTKLDLDLLKIKLFEPVEEIVKKPLLYVRDMTPKASYEALIKLHQLFEEYLLRSVIRCDLLPTSTMILSMSKEFGVPLSREEIDRLKPMLEQRNQLVNDNETLDGYDTTDHRVKLDDGLSSEDKKLDGEIKHTSELIWNNSNVKLPHTSRVWTPIDNQNDKYLFKRKDGVAADTNSKNYVSENIEAIQEISRNNKHKKPVKNYIISNGPSFNYSSQSLNSTELALNAFRDYINQANPDKLYTYNSSYHHSMTFVPVNLKQVEEKEKAESKSKQVSPTDWTFPGVPSSEVSNRHPDRPDPATLDKLKEEWEENSLHASILKSPLDRAHYRHARRTEDFDVWTKPKVELPDPITIFEAGDTKTQSEKQVQKEEIDKWKANLVVENERLRVHRLLASTENKIDGAGASNQLDRLAGLRKDEVKKKALLVGARRVDFNKIPALDVLKESYADKDASKNGYTAMSTDYSERITHSKYVVPVYYYDHDRFNKNKGKDFEFTQPSRSFVYKGSASPTQKQASNEILKSAMYIIPNQQDIEYVERLNRNSQLIE